MNAPNPPRASAGRVPPNNLEAEAAVLCACLEQPGALDVAAAELRPDSFYSHANASIFRACLALSAEGVRPDLLTVADWLRAREELARVGGSSYLAQIVEMTPFGARVDDGVRIVRDLARVRKTIAECQRIAAEGYGDIGDVDEWLRGADEAMHGVAVAGEKSRAAQLGPVLVDVFQRLQSDEPEPGMPFGLADLDRLTGGMKPGQLIVIGALSSVGKSSLALDIAIHVATLGPKPTRDQAGRVAMGPAPAALLFSLEMMKDELAERAIFAAARVDGWKMHAKSRITSAEWDALTEAGARLGPATLWIDDRQDLSPADLRAGARLLQAEADRAGKARLALVVVDYVQLVNGKAGLPKSATREQEVSTVGLALKNLAKELGVPVVALAQLNDDIHKRPEAERKPRMGDLRESKALAQHADKVILIHNPAAVKRSQELRDGYSNNDDAPGPEVVELVVGKNRGGRTGSVRALFFPAFTTFDNYDGRT